MHAPVLVRTMSDVPRSRLPHDSGWSWRNAGRQAKNNGAYATHKDVDMTANSGFYMSAEYLAVDSAQSRCRSECQFWANWSTKIRRNVFQVAGLKTVSFD